MSCSNDRVDVTLPVWTNATGTNIFIPFTQLRVNDITGMKMSLLATGSANLTIQRGVQYSQDGVTWGVVFPVGTALTGLQPAGVASWSTARSGLLPGQQWVRIGVLAKNTSGFNNESGQARLILNLRG